MAAHPIMGLVIGGVVIFIGIFAVTQVLSSVALPTSVTRVHNETINFAVNNTAYNFANQASCLDDYPLPSNCGIPLTTGVIEIYNGTAGVVIGLGNFSWTTSQITLLDDGSIATGNKLVTYDYYDYSTSGASTNWPSIQTTWWNSILLGAVSLITLAAALVLGSFFFK